jgi:hypothetical protein
MTDRSERAMNGGRANGEKIMRMRKNRKTTMVLGACLALWCLAVMVPSLSMAAPDSDGDGVANNRDLCDPTPPDDIFYVDANGCSDRDDDSVYGFVDLCPGTPSGDPVDSDGCSVPVDNDSDGYAAGVDCDDTDPAVNPGAAEACGDGVDNNCDGTVDEGCGGGPTDTDGDGYVDSEELPGITLPSGMTLADGTTTFLPNCAGSDLPRSLCVDESSPDVFIIVNRATDCPASNVCGGVCAPLFDTDAGDAANDSNIPLPAVYPGTYEPFNPLARIGETNQGGLGVTAHEVLSTVSSQAIAGHYAVKVNESLDPCTGSTLGLSIPGVPGPTRAATVNTAGIIAWINNACNEVCITSRKNGTICYTPDLPEVTAFYCEDGTSGDRVNVTAGESLDIIYFRLIPNIIVHEFGHLVDLATGSAASAYHLAAAGYFMEQSLEVKGTFKNGVVTQTIFVSDDFHPDSQGGYHLQ